jgi:hypothetical protein
MNNKLTIYTNPTGKIKRFLQKLVIYLQRLQSGTG